jgi:hypothetical protein
MLPCPSPTTRDTLLRHGKLVENPPGEPEMNAESETLARPQRPRNPYSPGHQQRSPQAPEKGPRYS